MVIEASKDLPREESQETLHEKKDFSELLKRVAPIVRSISRRPDLLVTTEVAPADIVAAAKLGQDARKAWYRFEHKDPKTKKVIKEGVHIPEKIFEKNENIAKGKAAHEAGHVSITRMGYFIPDEVMQELGFHQMIAAVEERPTDQVVRDRYPGAGIWVDEAREDSAREGIIYAKTQKIGYIPKSFQLGDLLVHGRHFEKISGKIPDYYDQEVIEIYNRTKKDAEKIENTLPDENADEKEIVAKAKERYKIAYTKLWPEAKKLVEQDVEQERLRQMLNKSPEQKEIEEALKELSEALKEELESLKQKAEEKNKDEARVEQEPADGPPMPMDEMSPRLLDALEKVFRSLPKPIQDALEAEAKKILEEIEDAIVEEFSGKFAEEPAETHKGFREKEEERERKELRKLEKAIAKEEMKDIERIQAAMEASKGVYDKTYAEIRELDEKLYRDLEEVFTPNIKRKMRLKSAGAKINLPAVFRWEGGKQSGVQVDNRIFESVHLPEKKDYVFTIMNDLSGSMAEGVKVEEDLKAKILFSEVLNRLGVENEILGFHRDIEVFKALGDKLTDNVRNTIGGIVEDVRGNLSRRNADGPCLLKASAELEKRPEKEKFLIVISDGAPSITKSGMLGFLFLNDEANRELHDAVKHVLDTTDQKLIGLGLGLGTEHVKQFYPTSLPNITVEELTETLGDLLKDMILNPQKYSYRKEPRA